MNTPADEREKIARIVEGASYARGHWSKYLPEADAIIALRQPPEGWVMVPKEPTEAMVEAGWNAWGEADAIYRAMITASPLLPDEGGEKNMGVPEGLDDRPRQAGEECPTCGSHDPKLHPAVQCGGEVSVCKDAFHTTPDRELIEAAQSVVSALDAPRYGDDSVWDDLNGFSTEPGPLDRLRTALSRYSTEVG